MKHKMVIFYSGHGDRVCNPEIAIREKANIMLTFNTFFPRGNTLDSRFKSLVRYRRQIKKGTQQ
jgi:hypothetical protein